LALEPACAMARFEASRGLPVVRVRFDAADGDGVARILCAFLCSDETIELARVNVERQLKNTVKLDRLARGLTESRGPLDALSLGIVAVPCAILEAEEMGGAGLGVSYGEPGMPLYAAALASVDEAILDRRKQLKRYSKLLEQIAETKQKGEKEVLNAEQLSKIAREVSARQELDCLDAGIRDLERHKEELLAWKAPTGLPLVRCLCVCVCVCVRVCVFCAYDVGVVMVGVLFVGSCWLPGRQDICRTGREVRH
jgi:hypothetical protein